MKRLERGSSGRQGVIRDQGLRPPGAALGGLIIGVVETYVGGSAWSNYRDAIAFAILIFILLFKPSGLFGSVEVEKV